MRIVRIDGIAEFPDSRPSVPAEYLPLRALGEEVLYSFAQEGAANAAERIRQAIDRYAFVGQRITGNITASMGIASYPEDGRTVEELIANSDKALYRAKRRGRNLVWLSGKRKPFSPV